jgi:hypothetical protein
MCVVCIAAFFLFYEERELSWLGPLTLLIRYMVQFVRLCIVLMHYQSRQHALTASDQHFIDFSMFELPGSHAGMGGGDGTRIIS